MRDVPTVGPQVRRQVRRRATARFVPVRQWRRLNEMATLLWSSGFRSLVDGMGLRVCVSVSCRLLCATGLRHCPHELAAASSRPERLVAVIEQLGPTYVKLGQMLASRSDYLPPGYAEAFRALQSHVTPFSGEEARTIVEAELGKPVSALFTHFEASPFAAASLSQVHRATLHDRTEVAVKVQRPGVERQIEADLELLEWVARRMERRRRISLGFRPTSVVQELAEYTRRELDFRIEAGVADQVRKLLDGDEHVVVPRVHLALTTARVHTMDLVHGVPPAPRAELAAQGLDADELLAAGARAMVRQIFELGLFQADPHPGNLLLLPGNRVCFLDFGLHGRVDARERRRMAMLLYALGRGRYEAVAEQLLHLSRGTSPSRRRAFTTAAGELVGEWYGRPTSEFSLGRLLLGYLGLGARFGIEFPRDLMLLARALVHLEATAALIDPDVSFADLLGPLLPQVRRALMPSRTDIEQAWSENWMEYLGLLTDLPEALPHLSALLEGSSSDAQPALPPRTRPPWAPAAWGAVAGAAAALVVYRRSFRARAWR